MKKSKRGGYRPNARRPKLPEHLLRVRLNCSIEQGDLKALDELGVNKRTVTKLLNEYVKVLVTNKKNEIK